MHAVETVFRERWEDPTPLSRSPLRQWADRLRRLDTSPDPLPRAVARRRPSAGPHRVQLLRTYPNLRHGRDYPFARGGERSVARGYTKAVRQARRLVYVEDQYFWGDDVAGTFLPALREHPELRLVVVIPLFPDVEGRLSRPAELLGRTRALTTLIEAAPGRVAAYGLENHAGTPVYVHAKVCVMDDVWASVGSDNFNRRSWTHDSELSCVVLDEDYATSLRLDAGRRAPRPRARRHRRPARPARDVRRLRAVGSGAGRLARRWSRGASGPPVGCGRCRWSELGPWQERLAQRRRCAHVHDPDGRPGPLRGGTDY